MKRLLLFIVVLSTLTMAFGQVDENEQIKPKKDNEMMTLLGRGNSIGGYGALSMAYTQIDGKDAFSFGARGAAIMGHSFALGIGGSGFVTDLFFDPNLGMDVNIAGGYGGLLFEPIFLPKYPIHLSVPVLVGVGGIAYNSVDRNFQDNWYVEDSEAFFVVEPGAEIELNVTRFFRFAFGAYYRVTSNIQLQQQYQNVPKDILNGFSYGVSFKFGKF